MELYHLKLFHIVAKNMSFSKAAEELHISQPAISMQIKKLEDEIGSTLIERYGRTISLTKEGQAIYNYTQKIFNLINEMETEINTMKGRFTGKIRIGASNTPGIFILPKILGIFKQKHPDVTLILDIGNTQEIHDKLIQDELDFAIVGGEVDLYQTFTVEKLVEDIMVLIVSPSNPLAKYEYIESNMLLNQQFITHVEASQLYIAAQHILEKLKLPFNVIMTLGSVEAIKQAVSNNLGIAFVPYSSAIDSIEMNVLKKVNIENIIWKYPYSLVYHNKKEFSTPMRLLLEMIKAQIKQIVSGYISP